MSCISTIGVVLPIQNYVFSLNQKLFELNQIKLSQAQLRFITYCLSSMMICGHLMFSSIVLQSLGLFSVAALSQMFRNSKIPFDSLKIAAITLLFEIYKPTKVFIGIDDTDRQRCKIVKVLGFVHKTVCKVTGGYMLAQNLVFVVLVTDRFTIPIAFAFYLPDPQIKAWEKEVKKLKEKGVASNLRPIKPERNINNPTRIGLCDGLLLETVKIIKIAESHINAQSNENNRIKVMGVLADAAYMSPEMCKTVHRIFKANGNFISQLKSNQICVSKNIEKKLSKYFLNTPKRKINIKIRGKQVSIEWASARLFIRSHQKKLMVIALRYEGEENFRYLAATNLTWRSEDIIKSYGLRWLVETFNEDWKQYCGWGKKAFQYGEDGARRGVFLSLLLDYFYLWHPLQVSLHKSALPLNTVGSLVGRLQIEYVITTIETALEQPDPQKYVKQIKDSVNTVFKMRSSIKHAAGGAGFEFPDIVPSKNSIAKYGVETYLE